MARGRAMLASATSPRSSLLARPQRKTPFKVCCAAEYLRRKTMAPRRKRQADWHRGADDSLRRGDDVAVFGTSGRHGSVWHTGGTGGRLIVSVLWLAGVSVLVAVILYAMNAPLVSAIELSVGAGLVTVIFVFAIGLAGELTRDLPSLIPRPLAVAVSIIAAGWLGWLLWPAMPAAESSGTASFQTVLWEMRAVDVWVQIALILAGVLGILNLVVDAPAGIEVVQAITPRQRKKRLPHDV